MNTLKDLFTQEELERYNNALYPFNLPILRTALNKKLEEDPDYEVFVPLIYYKFLDFGRTIGSGVISPYKYMISNKGVVVSLQRKTPLIISTSVNDNGYLRFNVGSGKPRGQIKILLHRAIACSFTPLREEMTPNHPERLTVNHIDGNKLNFELANLEWCTKLENIEHATTTGLFPNGFDHYAIKPIKGTVLSGEFKGFVFLLVGVKEITENGFDKAAVSRCCLGRVDRHLNCSFTFASPEEIGAIPRGVPEEVKTSISKINPKVKLVLVATNIETGESFTITGGKPELLSLGFDNSTVSKVILGKNKSHKGFTFKKIA